MTPNESYRNLLLLCSLEIASQKANNIKKGFYASNCFANGKELVSETLFISIFIYLSFCIFSIELDQKLLTNIVLH